MVFDNNVAILCLGLLAFTLLVFYIHAYIVSRKSFTLKGFTIADQTLSKSEFGNTFAAGTLSLSTVFAFMLATAETYGLWLLFAPLTMFLGTLFLASSISSYGINVGRDYTQASFTLEVFGSRFLARIITLITFFSFLGTVFLEIYFGTIIFRVFLPDGEPYKFISYLTIALLVLGYLRMGGYRVVVITDTWQMGLIGVSIVLLFTLCLFLPTTTSTGVQELNLMGNGSPRSIFVFCSWITVLNLFQPFGRLSEWQRFAALSSDEDAIDVTWASTWKFALAWVLPIISFMILINKGYDISGLSEFFDFFSGLSNLFQTSLFPFVYAGFAAMLLSTIDTRLIAALTSVADKATFGVKIRELEERDPDILKKITTVVVIVIFLILGVVYYSTKADFFSILTTLINVIFNGLTVFAPIVGYGIYIMGDEKTDTTHVKSGNTLYLSLGLIVSYLTIIGMSIFGSDLLGQVSLFVSLALMSFCVWLFNRSIDW